MTSKWEKHTGIIEFKVGDDTFKMMPSVGDWVKLQKLYGNMDPNNLTLDIKEDEMNELITLIVEAMARAEGQENIEAIKKFVAANFMTCMEAFTNMISQDNSMKKIIEDQREKMKNGSKPGQTQE
jgi:hypothetical protein